MDFTVLGGIWDSRQIAKGVAVRQRRRLRKIYGRGTWRKMKGVARIQLKTGLILTAELHWYEAHGIGKKEFKIKRILDEA